MRYAGSPLALSFSERDYKRSVQLVEFDEKGRVQATALPYSPLCRLLSLPERGSLDPEEALQRLRALPEAKADDDRNAYPLSRDQHPPLTARTRAAATYR